ncbi:MAG: divergent PAP2 family protein [Candidatus Peribacteraceae bacterium]
MRDLLSTYIFLIPVIVGFLSEIVKIVSEGITRGAWHEGFFRSGGMPSTHSAFVTSLLIVVWQHAGLDSIEFAIAFVIASLFWYDAMVSRKEIGEQAKVLNQLQKLSVLKERIGHSLKEVIGGIVFGAGVTLGLLFLL